MSDRSNRSQFAIIFSGTFFIGTSEPVQYDEEALQQKVKISKSFEMQTTDETQSQWTSLMGIQRSHFQGHDHPIETVTWYDAVMFIAKPNATSDGYQYRLPTEAEWEYAARARITRICPEDLDVMAWDHNNSDGKTHTVATKKANDWGLYDMHGNAWEWTSNGMMRITIKSHRA